MWLDVMGGDHGTPKKLQSVVNRIVDCLRMEKSQLETSVLASDEQAKLRAVNADPA